MFRTAAPPDLTDLVGGFWFPSWRVPAGESYPQRVLRYPVCLLAVAAGYARFYGPQVGLSTQVLEGTGSAAGVMLTPAAGALLVGESLAEWADRHIELAEVFGPAGAALGRDIQSGLTPGESTEQGRAAAADLFAEFLRPHLPVDDDGLLINRVVAYAEDNPEVTRVSQICDHFHLTERSLQRLTRRRLGLSPKWLIQRRRLQEAAGRLRHGQVTVARLASDLGYADEAHLNRDFRRVTGEPPGAFAARYEREST